MILSSTRIGAVYLSMSIGSLLTLFFPDKAWLLIPCMAVIIGAQRTNR